jgi:hypothetical protein
VAGRKAEGSDGLASEFSLMRTAIHESAHALIYTRFGCRPTYLWVYPNGGGETCPEPSSPWGSRLTPKQQSLVWQAGSAAECIWSGDALGWTTAAGHDRINLTKLLSEQAFDFDPNDFTEIGALLREPDSWNRVVKLAEALVDQHYIDNLDPYLTAN